MLTAGHGAGSPFLTNAYTPDGYVQYQTIGEGRFEYVFFRGSRNAVYETSITEPNGMLTLIEYDSRGDFTQSFPSHVPQ